MLTAASPSRAALEERPDDLATAFVVVDLLRHVDNVNHTVVWFRWMIEIDTLTKSFGPTRALAGVSFRAGAGEIVGLLGPNGAGKTTRPWAVATLLRPDGGTVRVDGIDVTLDPQGVRERIGLAGQAAAVDALLTGRENLELIGGLYGLDGSA